MILVDTMMISGLRWLLSTLGQAAAAEQDDEPALRAALLEAGVRLESGEIDGEEFARIEEDLLARIGDIRARGASTTGPISLARPAPGESFEVEASVAGDFHPPPSGRAPRRASPHARRARRKP